jgi:hypothetical protein
MQPLIGLRVRHVEDVLQPVDGGRHVVDRSGEAQGGRSPRAGVVVVDRRLRSLLPRKVLPLALKLWLGGLQVHLPNSQAIRLLLKVVRARLQATELRSGGVSSGASSAGTSSSMW